MVVVVAFGACVVEGSGDGASGDAAPEEDAYSYPLSCQEITDACHEVDPGSGPIHACHEASHDVGTREACDPVRDECIALCHAAADADAGDGDGGDGHAEPDDAAHAEDGSASHDAPGDMDMHMDMGMDMGMGGHDMGG
ncbi:MAG: hypothetical protein HY907_06535 [Deltaproteobacteria bacterium]|nr:hypothetical protein [Deltaproteobacteria bacterium]